uniref:CopG-like ribbon-helix-helix domain-containing protein n=1 Tax=Oscillatoriales cyanobacterium SpSt-402 TaxID=2282168 RepID=A0A832M4J1_9CYAN
MCHDPMELQEMADNERLSVLIPSELKQEFEALCKVERRSMSAQVVLLIEEAVKRAQEQGKIPDSADKSK